MSAMQYIVQMLTLIVVNIPRVEVVALNNRQNVKIWSIMMDIHAIFHVDFAWIIKVQ